MRWRLILCALLLADCRATPTGAPDNELAHGGLQPRALFEAVRTRGGFTPDAYVVWTPVWPAKSDELVMLYDLHAPNAPLQGAKQLEWRVRPDEGDPRVRPMTIENEIAVARVKAGEMAPGRFTFRSENKTDDNCGNPAALPLVPAAPPWETRRSEHFIYKWIPGDPVGGHIDEVLSRLEERRTAVLAAADLPDDPEQLTFLHYPSRDLGFVYQAHHGNNSDWSRNLVFSAEDEDDAHELTHLLLYRRIGRHVGLFDEGAAIQLGQVVAGHSGWWGRPCDDFVREALAAKTLPPLKTLLTPEQMYSQPWKVVGGTYYPAACSFVAYLLERFSAPRLKLFLGSYDCETQHDARQVEAAFEKVYGVSLDEVDQQWRARLK